MRKSNSMFSRKRASSAVRFPRVFSCSIASKSMLCCAIVSSGCSRFCPVVGSGASPRCTMTLDPSESTSALKSRAGAFFSSEDAIGSPEVELEFLQPVAALYQQDRPAALARLGDRLLEVLHRIHFRDRKSTRLNSSHVEISYAVFC